MLRNRLISFRLCEIFFEAWTIDLSIRVFGEHFVGHPACREHVAGNGLFQMFAQSCEANFIARAENIGTANHPAAEIVRGNGDDGTLLKFAQGIQGRLDLSEFNAISANFDLGIGAADKVERPLFVLPSKIAGTVKASSRIGAMRVANERGGGLLLIPPIAWAEAPAGNIEVANFAGRQRLQFLIEYEKFLT